MHSYKVGRAPYKSHRSNVGYRGLIHRILGRQFVIPRRLKFDLRSHKRETEEYPIKSLRNT